MVMEDRAGITFGVVVYVPWDTGGCCGYPL